MIFLNRKFFLDFLYKTEKKCLQLKNIFEKIKEKTIFTGGFYEQNERNGSWTHIVGNIGSVSGDGDIADCIFGGV